MDLSDKVYDVRDDASSAPDTRHQVTRDIDQTSDSSHKGIWGTMALAALKTNCCWTLNSHN